MTDFGLKYLRPNDVLSASMERVILKIFERGPFEYKNGSFKNETGESIYLQSIVALCERFLVSIVSESRHRSRQTACLTRIGEHVAKSIKHQRNEEVMVWGRPKNKISEDASLLASEIIAS